MVQRLCLLNDSLFQPILSCPHNIRKGVTNEPISKTITDDLALPYCLDAKIQISNSDYLGTIKGRTSIRVLNTYRHLREKPYWGNHFFSKGYCVDTVGLDSKMIRKYVKYKEAEERRKEQVQGKLF